MAGARSYIKKIGIRTDQSLHKVRRQLLKSLSANDQARIEYIWTMRDAGLSSATSLTCCLDQSLHGGFDSLPGAAVDRGGPRSTRNCGLQYGRCNQ
jgi:hypothetical protein